MNKVLITGGTGFLAAHLADYLKDEYEIALLCRSKSKVPSKFPVYNIDIDGRSDFSGIFDGVSCVIHCAARTHIMSDSASEPLKEYREVNTIGTARLSQQAAIAGVKRFIFISSIKVNGEKTEEGKPYDHLSSRQPEDYYGQSKSEAELELLQLAEREEMEVVIIRPTLIYGPKVKANFALLMKLVSLGLPLPFGKITNNKRSLIFVDNLVDLISVCISHPSAVNKVFLASDGDDVSTCEMIRELAQVLGKPTWQLPVPICFFRLLGKVCNKRSVVDRLTGSLQVDISFTKETLEWKPPYTVQEGFEKTADEYLKFIK